MKKADVVLILAAAVAAVAAAPQAAQGEEDAPQSTADKLKTPVTFNFVDQRLTAAIGFLRDLLSLNIVVGPEFRRKDPRLTLRLEDVSCRKALAWIARTTGATCSVINQVVCFGTGAFIKRCKAVRVPRPKDEALQRTLEHEVSFDFVSTPLADVAVLLRNQLKVNVVVVGGTPKKELVTVRIQKVPAGVALKYIGLSLNREVVAEKGAVAFNAPAGQDDE